MKLQASTQLKEQQNANLGADSKPAETPQQPSGKNHYKQLKTECFQTFLQVFLDISVGNTEIGRIILELFADVTPNDFAVDISKVQEQFDIFKGMTGIKKIISFGGWDFSTMPGTFNILRTAVR